MTVIQVAKNADDTWTCPAVTCHRLGERQRFNSLEQLRTHVKEQRRNDKLAGRVGVHNFGYMKEQVLTPKERVAKQRFAAARSNARNKEVYARNKQVF